jgi:hypothetical protein
MYFFVRRSTHGQRHRTVFGQEAATVVVENLSHLDLAARELFISQSRPFLENGDADAILAQGSQLLGDRAAAGAGSDDDDVVGPIHHHTASHPRGSGR